MVCTVLVLLVQADPRATLAVPALVIIGRGDRGICPARVHGRCRTAHDGRGGHHREDKTSAQMAALLLMLYRDSILAFPVYEIGLFLLYLSAFLTLWSMLVYLRAAWPQLESSAVQASLDSTPAASRIPGAPGGEG